MKLPLWALIWVLVIELFLILAFVPGDWTETVIQRESQKVERSLGSETVDWIRNKADGWYTATMLDSGAYRAMYRHIIPSKAEREASVGMENLGATVWPWAEDRLNALMHVIYQVFTRVALFAVWAPYILILLVPAVWDGMMSWRVKRTNFDYASPVLHRYGTRGTLIVSQLLLIAFFIPLALNPMVVPLAMMLVSLMIGVAIANFQKRV